MELPTQSVPSTPLRGSAHARVDPPRLIPEPPGGFPGLPSEVALAWLVRLRWLAVAGQLAALVVGAFALELALPLPALLLVVALAGGSNVLLAALSRRSEAAVRTLAIAALALDLVLLTVLLALAGGPASHFAVLFLVPISLAALVLGTGWGWIALGASSLCYASLFLVPVPVVLPHDHDHGLGLHVLGMWIATALAAAVIATVVGGIASTLRLRERELRTLEARAHRNERLVALSTLAAGAAHELGSPLATIAVAARELERAAGADATGGAGFVADARLIREQVGRCRDILAQMGDAAGNAAGEGPETFDVGELVTRVVSLLAPDVRSRVRVEDGPPLPALFAPRGGLSRAVANLVRNGLDSAPDARVQLIAERADDCVRLHVRDDGPGMTDAVLARAGEPFFTTKPPGAGQGLGLFLARAVAEQLGGSLTLASRPGHGTSATLDLPCGGPGVA